MLDSHLLLLNEITHARELAVQNANSEWLETGYVASKKLAAVDQLVPAM